MKCLRCGNEDPLFFFCDHGIWYCRKCVAFGRLNINELPMRHHYQKKCHHCHPKLKYPLTTAQQLASAQVLQHVMHQRDCLVFACCGAGKTEIVMETIAYALSKGRKVGFAISRRQVVLEIKQRMQEAFPELAIIAVCEGYCDITDGDVIVCTMHQLYRYDHTFDLLIMDEVDAFPYRNNDVLISIADHACIGQRVYLTATPDQEMLDNVKKGMLEMVELFERPHGYPLIEPVIKTGPMSIQILHLLLFLKRQRLAHIQTLLFVPTIACAERLHHWLRLWFSCTVFTSKTTQKEKIIDEFHHAKYDFLIATTVLERGITIRGIYVVVLFCDHPVFNESSLIQMIGRVGRRFEMPTGKGLFLCTRKSEDVKACVETIRKMNGCS